MRGLQLSDVLVDECFRWKVLVGSIYIQDLSLGIESASDDSFVGAKRIVRNSRGGLERLSLLSHGYHGEVHDLIFFTVRSPTRTIDELNLKLN